MNYPRGSIWDILSQRCLIYSTNHLNYWESKINFLLCSFNFEEALLKISQSKLFFEKILKYSGLANYLNKLFEHLNFSLNSTNFTNLNFSNNSAESISKAGNENILKILNFCILILNDINYLIEKLSSKNYNYLSDFFIIVNSLKFYRPVQLNDDRFLDDLIDLN